ncbi:MAG: methyltransferase domain-containing protein [Prochlorococcaceae cyanobacterium]
MPAPSLPYFDQVLQRLEAGDPQLERCFGQHVHWGYWPDPTVSAAIARQGFPEAAEALTRRLLEQAQIQAGQSILDVGCGFGGTIASLNRHGDGLALTGLNLDARQIERARQFVQPRPGNTVEWLVADACALPLAAASQDVVLAVECIFHFPSRDAFLQEVQRVLRPGGRLVLSDFVPAAPLALVLRALQKLRGAPFSSATYGPVDCRWDRRRYAKEAARHGLQLRSDTDITPHTLPTYGVVRELFEAMGAPQAVRDTERIEQLSRWGWLHYRILSFSKPIAPTGQ